MDEDTIVLVDEEGFEHSFTLYRILEVDDVRYACSSLRKIPMGE